MVRRSDMINALPHPRCHFRQGGRRETLGPESPSFLAPINQSPSLSSSYAHASPARPPPFRSPVKFQLVTNQSPSPPPRGSGIHLVGEPIGIRQVGERGKVGRKVASMHFRMEPRGVVISGKGLVAVSSISSRSGRGREEKLGR